MAAHPAVGDPGTDTVAPPNDFATKQRAFLAVALDLATGSLNSPLTVAAAALGTNPAAAGTLRLPNNGWIASRNQANGADVNVLRVDSSDRIEVGAQLYRNDDGTGFGATGGAFLKLRRVVSNYTSLVQVVDLYNSVKGLTTVGERLASIRVTTADDASVVNKTITNITHVGTTATVTAASHGFANGDKIAIYGVTHTFNAEVNGSWTAANIAANTFDITVAGLSSGSYSSGGTATNRSMYYGIESNVNPAVARGGLTGTAANADDVACFVGYNGGTGMGTDAYYLGRNATNFPSAPEWKYGYSCAAYVQTFAFGGNPRLSATGAFFDASQATYDAGATPIRLPKNNYILFTDTDGASNPINFAKYDSTNAAITFGVSSAFGTNPALSGTLRIPNNTGINARNNANGGDVQMMLLTTGDEIQLSNGTNNVFFNTATIRFPNGSACNIQLGTTTGTKIGTAGGAAGQKLAFWNQTPIVQPVLATGAGATADNIITVLQNLGLCRQS